MSETEKRENGSGRLYRRPRSPFWWAQYYCRGEQVRVSTGTADEKKAEKFLRKKIGEVAAGVHRDTSRVMFADMRDSYLVDYVSNRRRSLRHDKEGNPVLDKVNRLTDFFEGYTATEIDTDLIRQYIADQQAKGLANATVNRSLSALRRMFNLARQDSRLRSAPYFPMLKESDPRQGFLEPEKYRELFAALPEYLRLPLAMGYYTAMRLGEVLGLEWSQVDLLTNTIRLRPDQTKNERGRIVPVVPELKSLLVRQRANRQEDCPWVCFKLDRKGRAVKIDGFRKAWYTACVKSSLGTFEPVLDESGEPVLNRPRGPCSKAKPKMVYRGVIFHDLRRSGVRNLVRSGTPESVAMKISGHRTRSVFLRYDITSEADIREAGEKLARYHAANQNGHTAGTLEGNIGAGNSSVN